MKELPGVPDAVISNAALGSATVEQYEPDPHKQDLALLQVLALLSQSAQTLVADAYYHVLDVGECFGFPVPGECSAAGNEGKRVWQDCAGVLGGWWS